ncbi:Methyl-accepting chemotaxis protein [Oceanospirillum multiglobuliferum]|uniref:Chemotaxis protein n=1 Tax=Oceanospirillum multiglobuliferum TaxID=64969 RepID=A0A1T4N6C4_9GAMM|nr:methyl-accepting chemotaxis protein [Oceanospirillum multiglobuliferum]OPX55856.1 hypothetical protein BTE48_06565 [Oceanospirillum multiglobuliferum]SJZ74860.1 Methyl-accepting chemotaxis protein [Oceanospirillum multiglobuliferum]
MNNLGLFGKMAVPIVALIALISLVLALFIPSQLHKTVVDAVIENSQGTVSEFKTLRKYYTENVIKKVLGTENLRPDSNHKDNPNKVPLPATMIHDLSALMESQGLSIKLYSAYPFPNRASRKLDSFEQNAWDQLVRSPDQTISEQFESNGRTIVRVAIADKMVAEACVSCHNKHPQTPKNDWKMGDVRGVLEVSTDITDQLAAGRATSMKITGLVIVMLLFMLIGLWVIYTRVIQRRMDKLNRAMNEIAHGDGDLTARLDESGNDEITQLSRSFNRFTGHIREMVQQMARTSQALNQTSEAMTAIAISNNDRLERQAAETNQAATAINEMAATVSDVARNAVEAAAAAQTANGVARDGHKVVDTTRQDIEVLSDNINSAMGSIRRLEEESENITGMVNVIGSIAEQTNLLALNAAIEAARAGEQGRGFAVVADEVRNLASRTQEATQEIQKVISELQAGTLDSVKLMSQSCTHAEKTVVQAESANDALNAIASAIGQITAMNDQIASASEEQSAVAHEIEQNIMAINEMSDESAHASEQMAHNSEQLTQLAHELRALVAKFKY